MLELNRLFSVECIYTAIEPIWEENFNYKKDLVYVVDGCADVLKDSKTYELTSGEIILHSEISYTSGYSSPSYFCDAFKRHTGFTPSEYKRIFNNTATYVQKNKENCNGDNA